MTEYGREYGSTEVHDPESEAAVGAAAAETGVIHLPNQHTGQETTTFPAYTDDGGEASAAGYDEDGDESVPEGSAESEVAAEDEEEDEAESEPGLESGSGFEPAYPEPEPALPGSASTYEPSGYAPGSDYVERIQQIQLTFIDDPRQAAVDADDLLAEVLQAFADEMARRRRELDAAASADGAAPDTENLRQSVRRSRELVELLSNTA